MTGAEIGSLVGWVVGGGTGLSRRSNCVRSNRKMRTGIRLALARRPRRGVRGLVEGRGGDFQIGVAEKVDV
jgi:hypothetical protein